MGIGNLFMAGKMAYALCQQVGLVGLAISLLYLDGRSHIVAAVDILMNLVAVVMDEPEWPIVRGKIDNVSPSVFLKYCETLGITPKVDVKPKTEKPKVTPIVGNSKWARGRVVNG